MIKKITTILCLALLFVSCKSTSNTQEKSLSNFDANTVWVLKSIKNKTITFGANEKPVTISFNSEAKSFNGYSGCNTFFGSYEESKVGEIALGEIIRTKKAGPQATMELENLFISTLRKVNMYKITEKSLELYQNETLALSFDKQE